MITWTDDEDPYLLVSDLAGGPTRIAVADTMPAAHVFGIRDALPEAEQFLAGPVTRELRMRKDAAEVAELRAAGAAIDRVHARMGEFLEAGSHRGTGRRRHRGGDRRGGPCRRGVRDRRVRAERSQPAPRRLAVG